MNSERRKRVSRILAVTDLRRRGWFEFDGNMCKTRIGGAVAMPIHTSDECNTGELYEIDFFTFDRADKTRFWKMVACVKMGEALSGIEGP
jgi:hypothetical protein